MRPGLILLCNLICGMLFSQNYVVNGSFERLEKNNGTLLKGPPPCKFSSNPDALNSAEAWQTFDMQTPDLITVDDSESCFSLPKPRRGSKMVGLIMYHPFQDGQFSYDYHELIQGTLARPLQKGKTYQVSFWVQSHDSLGIFHLNEVFGRQTSIRPVFCGNFGFYFSEGRIQPRENFMASLVDFPMTPQLNHAEMVNTDGEWQQISFSFKADKPYKDFLFGNFYSDAITEVNMDAETRMQLDESNMDLQFWQKTKRIAYYLFDDFAVVEDKETDIETALLTKKNYTLQSALLFESGNAELKPQSKSAIESLAAVLKKNPSLKVEIGGHTDDVGAADYNQKLSEQRAQTVCKALIAEGVQPDQLNWKGYGEGSPIASNDTATGRQKNRRVVFKVR